MINLPFNHPNFKQLLPHTQLLACFLAMRGGEFVCTSDETDLFSELNAFYWDALKLSSAWEELFDREIIGFTDFNSENKE